MRFGKKNEEDRPVRLAFENPKTHPFIGYVGNRLMGEFNQNWLSIYTGGTGSGKSYGSLRTCEMYYDAFKPVPFKDVARENVVFSAKDFMERVQQGNFERGDLLIWDEAGVGVNSRDWYSISNKAIVYVLQTFRHLNLGVIFTTPAFGYIDKAVRPLFHDLVAFQGSFAKIDRSTYSLARTFRISTNQFDDKIYFRTPYFKMGSQYRGLAYMYFSMPGRGVRKCYEVKKEEFSQQLRKEMKEVMDDMDAKNASRNTEAVFNELVANASKYFYMDKKGKFSGDIGKIMRDFKVGNNVAVALSKSVLRMGIGDAAIKA